MTFLFWNVFGVCTVLNYVMKKIADMKRLLLLLVLN